MTDFVELMQGGLNQRNNMEQSIDLLKKMAKNIYDTIWMRGYRQGQAKIHELEMKNKRQRSRIRALQKGNKNGRI